MRRVTTFVLLLGMLGGFGLLLGTRAAPDTPAPSGGEGEEKAADVAEGEAADDKAGEGEAGDGKAADEKAAGGEKAGEKAPEEPKRPVRVVGLGWEVLAAGVLANDGLDPGEKSKFKEAGVETHFAAVANMGTVQKQLARGGADEKGADVALLPLPDFVASYERLRGLDPKVFFIVGWSYGRDGV